MDSSQPPQTRQGTDPLPALSVLRLGPAFLGRPGCHAALHAYEGPMLDLMLCDHSLEIHHHFEQGPRIFISRRVHRLYNQSCSQGFSPALWALLSVIIGHLPPLWVPPNTAVTAHWALGQDMPDIWLKYTLISNSSRKKTGGSSVVTPVYIVSSF